MLDTVLTSTRIIMFMTELNRSMAVPYEKSEVPAVMLILYT